MDKSNTLPEVMAAMLKARCKDERKYYVCILGLEEEQYKTFIVGEDSGPSVIGAGYTYLYRGYIDEETIHQKPFMHR